MLDRIEPIEAVLKRAARGLTRDACDWECRHDDCLRAHDEERRLRALAEALAELRVSWTSTDTRTWVVAEVAVDRLLGESQP